MPIQDTNEHTVIDDLHQQPLHDSNSGQMLHLVQLSQVKIGVKAIIGCNMELSTDVAYQQLRNLSGDSLPPSLVSLVCNYSNTSPNTILPYIL